MAMPVLLVFALVTIIAIIRDPRTKTRYAKWAHNALQHSLLYTHLAYNLVGNTVT